MVQYLPCYEWLLREVKRYGSKWKKCWAQEPALKKIISLVPNILTEYVQIMDTTLYPGWQDYLKCFLQVGGLIEGVPPSDSITPVAVDIMIEPTGQIKIHCTLDQVRPSWLTFRLHIIIFTRFAVNHTEYGGALYHSLLCHTPSSCSKWIE